MSDWCDICFMSGMTPDDMPCQNCEEGIKSLRHLTNIIYVNDNYNCNGIKSVFLAGPTIRSYLKNKDGSSVKPWRPLFIRELRKQGYDGLILVPETPNGGWLGNHEKQIDWEYKNLYAATIIAFWIPRNLETLPGFTTNYEIGFWMNNNKSIYGRPDGAPKTKYLDYMYKKLRNLEPNKTIESMVADILGRESLKEND